MTVREPPKDGVSVSVDEFEKFIRDEMNYVLGYPKESTMESDKFQTGDVVHSDFDGKDYLFVGYVGGPNASGDLAYFRKDGASPVDIIATKRLTLVKRGEPASSPVASFESFIADDLERLLADVRVKERAYLLEIERLTKAWQAAEASEALHKMNLSDAIEVHQELRDESEHAATRRKALGWAREALTIIATNLEERGVRGEIVIRLEPAAMNAFMKSLRGAKMFIDSELCEYAICKEVDKIEWGKDGEVLQSDHTAYERVRLPRRVQINVPGTTLSFVLEIPRLLEAP